MISNPSQHVESEAENTSHASADDESAGFNFTTILCVAWSSCGRNLAFGTPDGLLIFSTEQVLEQTIAANARTANASDQQQQHAIQSVADAEAKSREPSPSSKQASPARPIKPRVPEGDDADAEREPEDAESLKSMSPLEAWTGEEAWSKYDHHSHDPEAHPGDTEDEQSDQEVAGEEVGVDPTAGHYLIPEKEAQDQVAVREVCRRLVEGGVGTLALCGQSSIVAVAGVVSPLWSPHAAATVKVLDLSEPYNVSLTPPNSMATEGETLQPSHHADPSEVMNKADAGDAGEPVSRGSAAATRLTHHLDVVGAAFPTGNLSRIALEEQLLRASCEAQQQQQQHQQQQQEGEETVQSSVPSDGVEVPSKSASTTANSHTAEVVDVQDAIITFRRRHGPAILWEHTFPAAIGGLCLTPHYVIVAQSGDTAPPEMCPLYIYDRQWQQRVVMTFWPSKEDYFVRDCIAAASTWTPSAVVRDSQPSHHALLPGKARGEVRLLCYRQTSVTAENDSFSVDQLQPFSSTPIRAVAITADGTRAVVTSEEGKRIKLVSLQDGKFGHTFISLDRGMTPAVIHSVSLHIINLPDWRPMVSAAVSTGPQRTRYVLLAMATTTGTVHTYMVDVAREVMWECPATDTCLQRAQSDYGVSLRFPDPTVTSGSAQLLVLQYPDGTLRYRSGVPGGLVAPGSVWEVSTTGAPTVSVGVSKPFRLASFRANVADITRAERLPAIHSTTLVKSATSWLKRDVAGSRSSGVVPGKGQGSIGCQLETYLPFL